MNSNKNLTLFIVIAVAVVTILTATGVYVSIISSKSEVTPESAKVSAETDARHSSTEVKSFSATGNYNSPAGNETIKVDLTLQNNKITDLKITPEATHPVSKKYQNLFAEGIKGKVIGKNISDSFNEGNISGSSLTITGFNDAVAKIRQEANSK